MKIGLYSITYRGVWYNDEAMDIKSLMGFIKNEGWEGVELDTERPHAAPMDFSKDDRKELRELSGELELPICAISPSCELSSPVPIYREAMICYVRECIKLAHDVGAPLCKIFAAWRGITLYDGLGTYNDTYGNDPYRYWKGNRRNFVLESIRELSKVAEDYGITLAIQNHGPDIIKSYKDVLKLIQDVDSPYFKACMDLCNEDTPGIESADYAKEMVRATGNLLVHSHFNGEFSKNSNGEIDLTRDDFFGERKVAYPSYVEALIEFGYEGFMNWEFCHPAKENGKPAGIDYVHRHTRLALEYMKKLRVDATSRLARAD